MRDDVERPYALTEGVTGAANTQVVPKPHASRCIVCESEAGVHLATSPVCPAHASPVALSQALQEARAERDAMRDVLKRWSAACAAFDDAVPGSWNRHLAWMDACEAERDVKTLAAEL
jgi:hypothetical protein